MSDTPRTNAIVGPWSSQTAYVEMAELARSLERELAAAKGRDEGKQIIIAQLEREVAEWKHNFEVANTKDHEAIEADRVIHRALGRLDVEQYAGHLQKAAEGVGAWLLHRFGPDTPEGREGKMLLDAALAKNPNMPTEKRILHPAPGTAGVPSAGSSAGVHSDEAGPSVDQHPASELNEQLRSALADDCLVREIQMQLRPYEPISEEKVREQYEDIRQGIAIYLDDRGLADAALAKSSSVPLSVSAETLVPAAAATSGLDTLAGGGTHDEELTEDHEPFLRFMLEQCVQHIEMLRDGGDNWAPATTAQILESARKVLDEERTVPFHSSQCTAQPKCPTPNDCHRHGRCTMAPSSLPVTERKD